MKINYDRIRRAQELMTQQGMIGIMIMNHDDFRYFFGAIRVQPRAIIPAAGSPVFICFKGEEPELRKTVGDDKIKVFAHVGEQISDVKKTFHSLFKGPPPGLKHPSEGRPKVGMQMWFHTPAFLVDLFRKINKEMELVSSDPVMDPLRMVKEPEEIELMKKAQSIAALGMDKAKEMLSPGISGHEMATEILYTMMKAGAEGTSTPIHINPGTRSCWIHGTIDKEPLKENELVVIDLTPQFEGYCSNLARTYVVGQPNDKQKQLLETYKEMHEVTRQNLRPGISVSKLDAMGKEVCAKRGFEEYHLNGISHGIGLRFEETPASTIIPPHKVTKLQENMTVTVGHTVLAVPGVGGARFEDVYLVTPDGGIALHPYPV